jgi:hypothetical protein
MEHLLYGLLLSYGVCFGIQQKLGFLYGRHVVLDKLLSCTYCVGFHSGWLSYLLIHQHHDLLMTQGSLIGALIWGFSSAGFCYSLDAAVTRLEAS